jgi:hypothetical protein
MFLQNINPATQHNKPEDLNPQNKGSHYRQFNPKFGNGDEIKHFTLDI